MLPLVWCPGIVRDDEDGHSVVDILSSKDGKYTINGDIFNRDSRVSYGEYPKNKVKHTHTDRYFMTADFQHFH